MAIAKSKIVPHLWFDTEAREAAELYVSIFPDSRIDRVRSIGGTPSGNVDVVSFTLSGQPFMAISAGPAFRFNEAISFLIECADQAEIDYYWAKLGAGGDPAAQQCGWLKDRFGVSWQVNGRDMGQYLGGPDAEGAARASVALQAMEKIDLEALRRAYDGSAA